MLVMTWLQPPLELSSKATLRKNVSHLSYSGSTERMPAWEPEPWGTDRGDLQFRHSPRTSVIFH